MPSPLVMTAAQAATIPAAVLIVQMTSKWTTNPILLTAIRTVIMSAFKVYVTAPMIYLLEEYEWTNHGMDPEEHFVKAALKYSVTASLSSLAPSSQTWAITTSFVAGAFAQGNQEYIYKDNSTMPNTLVQGFLGGANHAAYSALGPLLPADPLTTLTGQIFLAGQVFFIEGIENCVQSLLSQSQGNENTNTTLDPHDPDVMGYTDEL